MLSMLVCFIKLKWISTRRLHLYISLRLYLNTIHWFNYENHIIQAQKSKCSWECDHYTTVHWNTISIYMLYILYIFIWGIHFKKGTKDTTLLLRKSPLKMLFSEVWSFLLFPWNRCLISSVMKCSTI